MSDPELVRSVQVGDLEICLYAHTLSARRECQRLVEYLASFQQALPVKDVCSLTVVGPDVPVESDRPTWLSESHWAACVSLHQAWVLICQESPHDGSDLTSSMSSGLLKAWRALFENLDEATPRYGLLCQKEGKAVHFFCLIHQEEDHNARSRLLFWVLMLATWRLARRGGFLLHAAAVARRGKAYVFLGSPGAGKSTIASLSASVEAWVLDDESVFVLPESGERCLVSAAPRLDLSSPFASDARPASPLCGFFVLVQSKENHLVPLSPLRAAQALVQGISESTVNHALHPDAARLAFGTACRIARQVPAFELHFRKSPTFWDVIDEQFGR